MIKQKLLNTASASAFAPAPGGAPNAEKTNAPTDTSQDEFLDEEAVARRWNCTIRKLQKDRLTGTGLPFYKLGGLVRYRLADVLAYETANQYRSTSEYRP